MTTPTLTPMAFEVLQMVRWSARYRADLENGWLWPPAEVAAAIDELVALGLVGVVGDVVSVSGPKRP